MRQSHIVLILTLLALVAGCKSKPDEVVGDVPGAIPNEKPVACSFGACGNWVEPIKTLPGNVVLQTSWRVFSNQIIGTARCIFDDNSVSIVRAASHVVIDNSSIRILDESQNVVPGPNNLTCAMKINATVVNYYMAGDGSMTIESSGGTTQWTRPRNF